MSEKYSVGSRPIRRRPRIGGDRVSSMERATRRIAFFVIHGSSSRLVTEANGRRDAEVNVSFILDCLQGSDGLRVIHNEVKYSLGALGRNPMTSRATYHNLCSLYPMDYKSGRGAPLTSWTCRRRWARPGEVVCSLGPRRRANWSLRARFSAQRRGYLSFGGRRTVDGRVNHAPTHSPDPRNE
jgi:hypothetical protein